MSNLVSRLLQALALAAAVAALSSPLSAQCTYNLTPSSASGAAGGGTGSFTVSATSGCTWSAASGSGSPWLTVSLVSGNTVNYAYPSNPNLTGRAGSITILDANSNVVQTFTLNQAAGSCSYSLSSTSSSFNSGGGTGSFSVFATSGCSWAATTTAGWVTITTNPSGSGNGSVSYSVAQNSSTTGRSAIINIGTQAYTITQNAACSLTLTPSSASFPYTGGNGSINVGATAGNCDRSAVSANPDWLTISFGQTGTGNGSAGYSVAANNSTVGRTGTITVGGSQTFTVTQDAAPVEVCTFTLSPTSASVNASSGLGSITVTATAQDCQRTAISNNDWITISLGQTGTGSGTVGYAYSSNTSITPRTGSITIGNATFTLTQAGGTCSYTISPTTATVSTSGGTGSFTVTATSGCSWNPVSNSPDWLTITSGGGSGSGLVVYSAAQNTSPNTRTATITVGTQTFTVTQPGPCILTLSSNNQSFPYTGGSGSFTVTASASSCDRSVANSNPEWVTINSGATGTGSGLVTFTASPNPTVQPLTATLTVGGSQTFTITEDASPFQTCVYSLAPSSATASSANATGTINVTTSSSSCAWNATSNASWITVTYNQSGSGNAPVGWAVPANPTLSARSGTISVADQTFTLTQSAASCVFSLSSSSTIIGPNGGTGSFNVNVTSGCNWTPVSSAPDWLTVTSGGGAGSGAVYFSVPANPNPGSRAATIAAGTQTYTVTQSGSCVLTLSSSAATVFYNSGTGNFTVAASSNTCDRSAVSSDSWLTITTGGTGTGNGTVNYAYQANTQSQPRSATITVGGIQQYTVTQMAPNCTYAVNPSGVNNFAQLGGTGSFTVATTCSWTATPADSWVQITSNPNGTGNGTIIYSVQANYSTNTRQTSIAVGTATYFVVQPGIPCSFSLSPTLSNFAASGGTGNISLAASCSWTAATNASWISLTNTSGTSDFVLTYTVAANTTSQSRTGTITIGNQVFTVYQAGNSCPVTISPASASIAAAGGTGTFSISTPCSWTAASTASWIKITSSSTGSSDGSVTYSVDANPQGQSRTGSITVGGQAFPITQSGIACTYAVTPASANIPAAGGQGSVSVTTPPGCAWTATASDSWISVTLPGTAGSAGVTGSGMVSYSVTSNASQVPRTGTIAIKGQTVTLTQAGGAPQRALSAVLNAASYSSGPVCPGEIVTLFGSGIGPADGVTMQLTPDGSSVMNSLGNTQVLFDGNPAPMVYTSDQQVTAIVPYAVAVNSNTNVQVKYLGQTSNALSVKTASSAPGIFSMDFSGAGQGAILNQDYTVNSPSNPAAAGSYVMIYATGEGLTTPAGVDGRLTGSTIANIARPMQAVTAQIAGIKVTPYYAGGAPGLVAGVLQVNVQIPANTAPGAQPVVLTIGGASSQTALTVSVK